MSTRTDSNHVHTLCPHCHHAIDVSRLEILEMVVSANVPDAQYRICPECDEPIVLSMPGGNNTRQASDWSMPDAKASASNPEKLSA